MMSGRLEQFVDSAFVYRFWQGPREVRSIDDAKRSGLNCVALAHLSLNSLFGHTLPPDEHCYEMYRDTTYFIDVPGNSDIQEGDIFWFGPARPNISEDKFVPEYDESGLLLNWRDSPVRHVAIATGETIEGDDLLLHATHVDGTNAMWPRTKFAEYTRYEREYRVARLALEKLEVPKYMQKALAHVN